MTDPDTGRPTTPAGPSRSTELRESAVQVAAVLAAYVLAGFAAGWVWFELWSPADGVVFRHQWYPDSAGLRNEFSGTALFVIVAVLAGVGLGIGCALAGSRRPLLVLFAAVVGSVIAAWLMILVGQHLGPADPQELAKTAKDQTRLPSALRVTGWTPRSAFTFGTLAALAAVYTIFPGRPESGLRREPRG